MYKKSLENRYYEILEDLVTLPGNFERLMSPVSDAGLSKVADILDDATNNKEADVKNKLVSRSFMTSLRQAFLMGKKWVGIAAVNITGHAIGQKVGLYFDSRLTDRLSNYDKGFLGNLKLAIPHNTTTVDGQEMISLGGLKTADGRNEFISDRLSGYATSFVDVAKDPYILKLIQSDLVVGTAMLMERIGAGELTAYFLNQPIIIEHLKNIDKTKSRSLFGKDNLNYTYEKFSTKAGAQPYDLSNEFERDANGNINFEKSKQNLLNLIRENANRPEGVKASAEFNTKQVAIFNEFLKLAKLAQLNFKFTQAYNYDTTKVTNYEGFKRKMTRTESAVETNIISSIDKVMDETFIGDQMRLLRKELMSLGAIMKLDSEGIDQYLDDVMEPFYENEYMSADDFNYVAKKLKSSFLDFLIQTRSTSIFPDDIKNLFTGENSVASRLLNLKKKYPELTIISNLVPVSSLQENGPVTVSLKVKPTDAIDVDMHIGMMRELKELEPEFYNDLVKLSVLQGTMDNSLSIASIVPVEDRAEIIAPVIDVLQPSSQLEAFNKEGLFYRNNFSDSSIVPEIKPRYKTVYDGLTLDVDYGKTDTFLASLTNGITPGSGKLISLNNKYSFMNQANKDFVKMRRYQYVTDMTPRGPQTIVIDITSGIPLSYKEFTRLSNSGTISKNEMVGYKKVKSDDGVPFTIQRKSGKTIDEFSVFKMVNLYGSPRIVTEYPKLMTPSALDNNTFKVEKELTDNAIIAMFSGERVLGLTVADEQGLASEVLEESKEVTIEMQPANIEKIKAGTKTTTTRSESQSKQINIPVGESAIVNFGGQDFKVTNRGQLTIDEAGGKEAMLKSEGVQSEEEFMYHQTKDWVNGKGKLYVYDIASQETVITQSPITEEQVTEQLRGAPQAIDQPVVPVGFVPVSPDYGVYKSDQQLSKEKTEEYINLIKPQAESQTFKENKGKNANMMFHYGLRWGRRGGNPDTGVPRMFSPINNNSADGGTYYGYDRKDQKGNDLPSIDALRPIMDEISQRTGIDMNNYDSVIANIYLEGEYIYPHRDTTEDKSAKNYPVVVYTLGNDAALGIWDYNKGGITFANTYDSRYAPDNLKGLNPTNEVLTKNGSIYTFGLEGKGRFTLVHATPDVTSKPAKYPPIKLPNGRTIENYTITLTFRRAQATDVVSPTNYERLTNTSISQQPTTPVEPVEPVVEEVAAVEEVTPGTQKPKFTYKGTSIDTDFQLTEGQRQALEKLIDFSTDPNSDFITLQGAAGTGKTSIIGYLQKYLKSHKFNFFAPTHAATAELAFATVKSGNKKLPMTVASAMINTVNPATNEMVSAFSKKLIDAMGLRNNVFVVDEVSMLNSNDYRALKDAALRNEVKVIFMGDIMQIPEVDITNPEKKPVSKAFTELDQVKLTEVKRTSSNSILNMLTNIRNNVNDKIPIVESSDQLEYLSLPEFNSKLADVFEKNPEETVLISYTNKGVEQYNKKIRSVLGREGDLVAGDVIVGYLGYSSKQIEKSNIANSVRYTVTGVEKDGSLYYIFASSKKLSELQKLGVSSVSGKASTRYAQLSRTDSFDFSDLTEEDFDKNNRMLSEMMIRLHEAKQFAIRTKSSGAWRDYYAVKGNISMRLSNLDLGDTYIYNPATDVMEKYEYEKHKKIDRDLIIEKGIDFGHAITIHKSQGSTVKNVFFDATSLPKASSSKLTVNGEQIGTEKHSLLYVGVSRASEYLGINADNPSNFYDVTEQPVAEQKSRVVKVDQYQITVQPDGKMLFANGTEVTDQTIKNKVDIKIAFQDGTLRISVYNNNKYFVLSNNRILGSGKTNLGKETVTDPKIKQEILDKAVLYKPKC
jgi:hypothetical protein